MSVVSWGKWHVLVFKMVRQEALGVLKLKVLHYNWSKYPAVPSD